MVVTLVGFLILAQVDFFNYFEGIQMEDKEITLTLSVKEVDAILGAISKQPLSEVIDLFNKIRVQGIAQITPKQAEVKDE